MFTHTDLRDPAPPVPGATERAAVTTRAKQIKRNRRVAAAGGGALGVIAVLSLGVAAFASGGSTNPSTTQVEVAGTSATRGPAPTTVAPVPGTVAPVVAPDTPTETPVGEAPAAPDTPAPAVAPATYTVSGSVPGVPAGVTATVRLQGPGGSFTTTTAADGSFSIGGVPAGTYEAMYSWDSDGAAQVGRVLGGINVTGDSSFTFPG
jgi:hypothetical protein